MLDRPRPASSPAVAIFNDTAPIRHFGCEAVMAAIVDNVEARGGLVVYRHPVGMDWQVDPAAIAGIARADIVLVNGEGSIHHNSRAAADLAALGPYCATLHKPCYLINALIQGNKDRLMADLATFSGAWVREARSAEEMQRWGITAEICGDLSFFHVLPRQAAPSAGGLVLDAPNRDVSPIASELRVDYVAMRHSKRGLKAYRKRFMRWSFETGKPSAIVPGIDTFQKFAAFLASRRYVVTGRFHGLCFAVNCQVPFSAVPPHQNWKTEALLADIGLLPGRLYRPGTAPTPFDLGELDLMATYKAEVRGRIVAMFDRILAQPG